MIKKPKADSIAKLSFVIFIFVSFFPTSIPFQDTIQEIGIDEIGTSNLINQIIYSSLFLLSSIAAFPILDKIFSFIKSEKALSIFLLWTLITIIWSDYPFISFKRWFQIFTFYWIIVVYFLHNPSINKMLDIIKPIIYSYIIISLIIIAIIPEAKDPGFDTWRGLTLTKNNLGQVGVILSVITLIIFQLESNSIKRYLAMLFFLMSIIITVGTFSSTSYSALFAFLSISLIIYYTKEIFVRIGISYLFSIALVISSLAIFALIFYFVPQVPDLIQGIFRKSETFSDRGRLWQVILWNISEHPFLGCGFQGFWVIESPKIQMLYNSFVWLPIQGHNGYLDMLNEIGIIGMIFFSMIIIKYFKVALKQKRINLWIWFLILPLISSITESLLFRSSDLNTRFLFIAYVNLIINSNKQYTTNTILENY